MASDLLFVNGTLMRGLALHANLEGADFVEEARTAPIYRIFSIGDVHPGMYQVEEKNSAAYVQADFAGSSWSASRSTSATCATTSSTRPPLRRSCGTRRPTWRASSRSIPTRASSTSGSCR